MSANPSPNDTKIDTSQERELEFWEDYAIFMATKERKVYLNSPLYREEFKTIGEFILPRKGERWLDLGCGALPAAELIYNMSGGKAEVWGGDIYLCAAQRRLRELDYPPIKLKQIDLTKRLLFPDNYFDGIVASKVLNYIIESQGETGKSALIKIFQELFRILKPGGVLVWSSFGKEINRQKAAKVYFKYLLNPAEWIRARYFLPIFAFKIFRWAKPFEEKIKKGVYHSLSEQEYDELLLLAGFENSEWKRTFANQLLVNKVNKPL